MEMDRKTVPIRMVDKLDLLLMKTLNGLIKAAQAVHDTLPLCSFLLLC